jgi:hypothetical protein
LSGGTTEGLPIPIFVTLKKTLLSHLLIIVKIDCKYILLNKKKKKLISLDEDS